MFYFVILVGRGSVAMWGGWVGAIANCHYQFKTVQHWHVAYSPWLQVASTSKGKTKIPFLNIQLSIQSPLNCL